MTSGVASTVPWESTWVEDRNTMRRQSLVEHGCIGTQGDQGFLVRPRVPHAHRSSQTTEDGHRVGCPGGRVVHLVSTLLNNGHLSDNFINSRYSRQPALSIERLSRMEAFRSIQESSR